MLASPLRPAIHDCALSGLGERLGVGHPNTLDSTSDSVDGLSGWQLLLGVHDSHNPVVAGTRERFPVRRKCQTEDSTLLLMYLHDAVAVLCTPQNYAAVLQSDCNCFSAGRERHYLSARGQALSCLLWIFKKPSEFRRDAAHFVLLYRCRDIICHLDGPKVHHRTNVCCGYIHSIGRETHVGKLGIKAAVKTLKMVRTGETVRRRPSGIRRASAKKVGRTPNHHTGPVAGVHRCCDHLAVDRDVKHADSASKFPEVAFGLR